MNQQLKNLFELEQCFLHNNATQLLTIFKKVVNSGIEQKIDLVQNPGITIYSPQKVNNIKSKPNIVLVIHELSRTGAPVVTLDTAKTLTKNGFFVTVVSMRRGPLLKELLNNGIPVIIDRSLAIIYDSKELLGLKNNLLHIDTILEAFNQSIIITAVYYNLIRRHSDSKKPIIWWLHEGTATYDQFCNLMPRRLGPKIKVYAGGEYALEQLKRYQLPYNAKILNYGVKDITPIHSKPNKRTPSYPITFILPGTLGIRKGQNVLLDAINKLPQIYQKKSEFIFVGDVTSKADVNGNNVKDRLLAASECLKNIKYYPQVSRDELFNLYQTIDVLTLPSTDDPMPVVATEALMLRKVVLCSTATGTSYYIKDGLNGFIFPPNNPTQLCAKIKYIIDHFNLLPQIGQNGRKIYEKNFSIDAFEKKLLCIVKEKK